MKKKKKLNDGTSPVSSFFDSLDLQSLWKSLQMREPVDNRRERAYTLVAFAAITLAAVALTSAGISLPLFYAHIANVQTRVRLGLEYCQGSAGDVLSDVRFERREKLKAKEAGLLRPANETNVVKRQAGGSCPDGCRTCCLPGDPGPPGFPGRSGKPGRPGGRGRPGPSGKPPPEICQTYSAPPCKPCPPGSIGTPGIPGPIGSAGPGGPPGTPGKDGPPGPAGPPGPNGPRGTPGADGPPGPAGPNAIGIPATPGDQGPPGNDGGPGKPGEAGPPGADGAIGPQGPSGPHGNPGDAGNDGAPGDKGPPGTVGTQGEKGICPTYCAADGGAFFDNVFIKRI